MPYWGWVLVAFLAFWSLMFAVAFGVVLWIVRREIKALKAKLDAG